MTARARPSCPARGVVLGLLVAASAGCKSKALDGSGVIPAAHAAEQAASALPAVPLDRLPPAVTQFRGLLIQYTEEKDATEARLFTSAYLGSHFCAQETPEPTRAMLTPSEVAATIAPEKRARLRSLLACGQVLARALVKPYVTVVRFQTLGTVVDARFVELDIGEMPTHFGFVPHAVAGLPGFCQPDESGGCFFQSVHVGRLWVFGRAGAIDVVARALAGSGATGDERTAQALKQALAVFDDHATQRYVSFGSKAPSQALREALGTIDGTYSAFAMVPPGVAGDLDALVSGVPFGYSFDLPSPSGLAGAFLLVAGSEKEAQTLEAGLVPVIDRWRNAMADDRAGPLARAIRNLAPQRHERAVLLDFRAPLAVGEPLPAAARRDSQDERKASVASVFEAVLEGRPVLAADIDKLSHGMPPTTVPAGP
jgi:hypothetical protein